MLRQQALSSYRQLLRTALTAFKGDAVMTQAATQEIRTKFEQSRHETDEGAVRKLLDDGREASEFIQSFVVQGKLNERGNYEIKVESQHGDIVMQDPSDAERK
mmetsp:Transcript_22647/g.57975  ORF Transcript_22647/g.57975 Transcript_22647/m.57975 type:complete len:103 (-) Transcript_22647:120-428(-)|eukprot:jgi/Tetstr1/431250/TSEL_020947.t1